MAATKKKTKRRYPFTEKVNKKEVAFHLMDANHYDALQTFAESLSKDEMMFLRMDISQSDVLDAWFKNIEEGETISIAAYTGETLVGYCSLHRNTRTWTSHIGEVRVFVSEQFRGKGLSNRLLGEIEQIAREHKIERLVINLAREQRRFRTVLQEMGFQAEALLTDWLKSRDGNTHDLVIMSLNLAE